MARQRSEFLSSLGKLFSIFKKVTDKVLELGGSDEDITKIDTNDQLVSRIAGLLLGKSVEDGGSIYFNVLCVTKCSFHNDRVEPRWHLPIKGPAQVSVTWEEHFGVRYNFRTSVRFQGKIGKFVGIRGGLGDSAVVLRVEFEDDYPVDGWDLYTDTPVKPYECTPDELAERAEREIVAAKSRR